MFVLSYKLGGVEGVDGDWSFCRCDFAGGKELDAHQTTSRKLEVKRAGLSLFVQMIYNSWQGCKRGANVSGGRRHVKTLFTGCLYTESGMRMMIWSSSNVPRLSCSCSDHANKKPVCTDVLFIFYGATILTLFTCIDSACIQACLCPCSQLSRFVISRCSRFWNSICYSVVCNLGSF